jgi:DNA (cytosine-5)-methyltransferase 1
MKYLSVCSGIEAATCAWKPLGWEAVGFSEIEPFPSAVLAHRFPSVKNYGDMTKYKEWKDVGQFDVLVGGTPCQSFSVAGLRKGLNDPRGNLMLTFGAIADHFRPRWIVWENVPGVLSSNRGKDFGSFLGMLGKLGYGFAYRVLDAQYYGVAQRRRRVFVVGYFGDWRRAAQVLFDAESLSGNPAPSRETRKGIAFNAQGSACQGLSVGEITPTLDKSKTPAVMCLMDQGGSVMNIETDITGTLRSQTKGHEPVIMSTGQGNAEITEGHAPTLNCNHEAPILALAGNTIGRKPENGGNGCGYQENVSYTLTKTDLHGVMAGCAVRRLTPRECERLQGFPDDWTRIPWRGASEEDCPDGPRYKACGNSMAVPVMRWIGKRIIGLTTAST